MAEADDLDLLRRDLAAVETAIRAADADADEARLRHAPDAAPLRLEIAGLQERMRELEGAIDHRTRQVSDAEDELEAARRAHAEAHGRLDDVRRRLRLARETLGEKTVRRVGRELDDASRDGR